MSLVLGQLVYTSFPKVGYKLFVSTEVPTEIQQVFIQQIVYQHWNSYNPPKPGYLGAYLYQITPESQSSAVLPVLLLFRATARCPARRYFYLPT